MILNIHNKHNINNDNNSNRFNDDPSPNAAWEWNPATDAFEISAKAALAGGAEAAALVRLYYYVITNSKHYRSTY